MGLGAGFVGDNFDTDGVAGDALNGKNGGVGFASAWSANANDVTLQTNTLNPPIGPTGSSLTAFIQPASNIGNDNDVMSRTFAPMTSPVYVGFTVRSGFDATNDFFQLYATDAGGNMDSGLSVGIRNQGSKPFFARVGNSSNTTNSAIPAVAGQDYRIIGKFSIDGAGTIFNRTDLFVDPLSLIEGAPDATEINATISLTQLEKIGVRLNTGETADSIILDDLVISDNFADAAAGAAPVPEPASIALWVLVGLVALGFGRKIRQRR